LSLSLLSHLHHPRPNSPDIDNRVDSSLPLKGCFVVSPLASFNLGSNSYNRIFSSDVLCKETVGGWGELFIAESPWHEEITNGLGWGMALDVPEKWWEGLDVVENVLVTGGEEEVFRDHIEQLVDVLRSKSRAAVAAYISTYEAHDGPLMDFMARRVPGASTGVITRWIIENMSN
jgi:hypothetical protein